MEIAEVIHKAGKERVREVFDSMTPDEILALNYDWLDMWAREKQKPPSGDWTYWLIQAGRGWGKTKVGAETIRIWKDNYPILMLAGPTAADVRDVMVEGSSGILAVSSPWDRPLYEPSKRRLTWKNGAVALLMSADEPDRFRGPQAYAAWADELAAWRYPESWDMMKLGVRLGKQPRIIVTTTPRNTKVIRELKDDPGTVVTHGSTFENKENLAASFFDAIVKKYEGTRLGRQEIYAEILDDVEGALWTQEMLDDAYVKEQPEMKRIVVAIDPAVTSNKDSDETGIVVCGLGMDGKGYVLDDLSGRYSPDAWARIAIKAFDKHKADRVIAEVNNGGDLVETVIRQYDERISYRAVHASRGKVTRAEPVVALYEQGRIKHVGHHATLEDQMLTWNAQKGEKSPDRIDALVWGMTELMLNKKDTNVWI